MVNPLHRWGNIRLVAFGTGKVGNLDYACRIRPTASMELNEAFNVQRRMPRIQLPPVREVSIFPSIVLKLLLFMLVVEVSFKLGAFSHFALLSQYSCKLVYCV